MPALLSLGGAARTRTGRVLLALLITVVVAGAASTVAVLLAPDPARPALLWACALAVVLLAAAVGVATNGIVVASRLRARVAAKDAEAARLADVAMPELITRLADGASVDTALADMPGITDPAQQHVLRTLGQQIGRVERMRSAAMSACANAAGRVQALATSMLADLREMEDRHDEDVLGDLLKLDHSTAQAGRLADSIAVLTGARSGRRWTKPIVMESILRGAVGRISAYQRVQIHSTCMSAVVGYAAEGVMHALAEILDNATKFSPPSEQVHVYVEEVQAGVVVTVEDGGLVMGDMALARAQRAVSAGSLDLTELSGTRLGLAVVGSLAGKYGLTVSFRPSSRGGTGVVVMVPHQLVTEPRQEPRARPRTAPAPAARSVAEPGPGPADEEAPTGLPQRRRGETLASVVASSGATEQPARPSKPRTDAAAFGAFHRAIRGDLGDPRAAPDDSR